MELRHGRMDRHPQHRRPAADLVPDVPSARRPDRWRALRAGGAAAGRPVARRMRVGGAAAPAAACAGTLHCLFPLANASSPL
ncbi:hypothetical protein G6F46_015637 [Rhizopus delemar]|nr:hypothetical protein G6F46_015637 [Rhizopus delemar]